MLGKGHALAGRRENKQQARAARIAREQALARERRSRTMIGIGAGVAAIIVVGIAVALTSGGGGRSASSASLEHVHGLGINPKNQALVVATHTGLFSISSGSDQITRIGESDQDTMGFTVVGPDQFLGSGHPGSFSNGVNPLGLIRSNDGGLTWTNIALEGEADFHTLRASFRRVYGIAGGQLVASADGGQNWTERQTPTSFFDIAISPRDVDDVIAAGEDGLYASTNGGRDWRRVSEMVGLLAWAKKDRLYLADGEGTTHVSKDGGKRWSDSGAIGGQPAAMYATGESELYAALGTGAIVASTDGGASWTARTQP